MLEDIPKDLFINWNQAAPVSNWTQEVKGTKRADTDDKRQFTATLTITASEEMLPAQIIYGGKPACFPSVDFPKSWHITFTPNHWANEDTMVATYIYTVYVQIFEGRKFRCFRG